MNKRLILVFAVIFSYLGAYIPVLVGDVSFFDGWSILGGLIGGFVGIWLGALASRRWG